MLAQVEAFQNFIGGNDLFAGVGGERDPDGIADALIEQRANTDGAADDACSGCAGLSNADVQGVGYFGSNFPIGFDGSRHIEGFERDLNQVEVQAFQQLYLL